MNYPDFVTGPWTGFYNYQAGGFRHRMDLALTFAQGILSGQGKDRVGLFGIAGCYDGEGSEIHCTKTYFGAHSVRYRGFVDGCSIWGTWEIEGITKGGFHIWPTCLDIGKIVDHHAKQAPITLDLPSRRISL